MCPPSLENERSSNSEGGFTLESYIRQTFEGKLLRVTIGENRTPFQVFTIKTFIIQKSPVLVLYDFDSKSD